MHGKRRAARRAAAAKACAAAERVRRGAEEPLRKAASETTNENDVVPWLRRLGFSTDEAHAAAEFCETAPDDTLEDRVRMALSYFHPKAKLSGAGSGEQSSCPRSTRPGAS